MYARVIQFPIKPEHVDEAVTYFRDTVMPALNELDGFKKSNMLTNASTNQGVMITFWESEAHRQGAETNGFLQGVLKHIGSYFAGVPTIDYYEVSV